MGRAKGKENDFDLLRVRLPLGSIQCLKECAALETEETGMTTTMSDIVRSQIGDYLRDKGITPRRNKPPLRSSGPGFIPSGRDAQPVNSLYQVARFDLELGAMFMGVNEFDSADLDDDDEE